MTKKQIERYYYLVKRLDEYNQAEIAELLKCSRGLSRWDTRECNGEIQREEDNTPYYYNTITGKKLYKARDTEKSLIKKANSIIEGHGHIFYHQTDPQGCALYIIKNNPDNKDISCYYSSIGIAVCID